MFFLVLVDDPPCWNLMHVQKAAHILFSFSFLNDCKDVLYLDENNIGGTIPSELGRLKRVGTFSFVFFFFVYI